MKRCDRILLSLRENEKQIAVSRQSFKNWFMEMHVHNL